MEFQSIYFDIDLAANLAVREWLDVSTLPFERIVGELFKGSVVLVDRHGNCHMLHNVPVAQVIGCLDAYLQARPERYAAFAERIGCGNLGIDVRRRRDMLVVADAADNANGYLEFDPPAFEALWNDKKKAAGTLFWLLYPELEAHAEADRLRGMFA